MRNLCRIAKIQKVVPNLEVTTDYRNPKWCMVRDNKDEEWEKRILINDNSNLSFKYCYFVVPEPYEKDFLNGKEIPMPTYFRYAKPCPEYKAYSQPKLEWVLEHRKFIDKDTGEKYTIEAIGDEFILTSRNEVFNLTYLFNNFTWLDGSPCGDLV